MTRIAYPQRLPAAAFVMAASLAVSPVHAQDTVHNWTFTSGFTSNVSVLGPAVQTLADEIALATDGKVVMRVYEPDSLVPVPQMLDALQVGSIDAAFGGSGWFAGKDSAFGFFVTTPFGPSASELLAWYYHGGGKELHEEIFASYNVKPIMCHMIPPAAAGWFKQEINSIEDLRGLKFRIAGLGAAVAEKIGMAPQTISPTEIYSSLERGVIDGSVWAFPSMDLSVGFDEVARYYYFPGWHQQNAFNQLWINRDRWDALTDSQRKIIELTCGNMIAKGLAEGEALQIAALNDLAERGVEVRTLPDEVLEALEAAWAEVVEEQADLNPNYRAAWESLKAFREKYRLWGNVAYLRPN